ncbi:hypothetical protein [Algibacter pacificus]|uniref:hypothetical protein n=1 Tax=Algibacter pacificus TaxID=2599389 RepID=UPI0016502807|nr:hypothetical protein [Algibacter pacificus]
MATQLGSKKDSSNQTSALSALFEAFVPVYFKEYKQISFFNYNVKTSISWDYKDLLTHVFIDKLDPPPKV